MGEVLEWLARMLFPDRTHPLAHLDREAESAGIGAGGVLSSLGVVVMNGRELELPLGQLSVSHLAPAGQQVERGQLARSCLEGAAYGVRANLEQILAGVPTPLGELHLTGGLSHSSLWPQLLCDVLSRPLQVATTREASALGAAICAGVGAGAFPDLAAGATALVRLQEPCVPEADSSRSYGTLFAGWQKVRESGRESRGHAAGMALQATGTSFNKTPAQAAPAPLRVQARRPSTESAAASRATTAAITAATPATSTCPMPAPSITTSGFHAYHTERAVGSFRRPASRKSNAHPARSKRLSSVL